MSLNNPAPTPERIADNPTDYYYIIPGAILMDGLLHSFCLGFVLALGLKYWEDYPNDSVRKRIFVFTVVFLSTLQTVLQDYKVWTVTVFRHPWSGSPLLWTDVFLNGIICSMCEAFYIRRCWKMTGKRPWVLYPMILLWISITAANFYIAITLALEFRYFGSDHTLEAGAEKLLKETLIVFSYWLAGSSVLDIAVAVILITCLLKSKTGLEASNSVLNRVILLTLETALLPSISMVIAVLILHLAPNPGTHDDLVLFFVLITAKLYAIGLLRTLNARAKLRERLDSHDLGRTSLRHWSWNQAQTDAVEKCNGPSTQTMDMSATQMLRECVETSATYNSQAQYQGVAVAVQDTSQGGATEAQPNENAHVHFGSPLLDQHERGSYARLRIASIQRTRSQMSDEHTIHT
ncbi:hypothetical protein B0H10DRAFT_104579 [Mycena sp. CBHHK59/15]|nr:hypothetical protein B0H10DRAFT_104579 [Mycena sp. CBHHK59/15]